MLRHFLALLLLPLAALSWRAPGDTRPNFIVYIPDTIRAEALSAYGHPFVKSPNVDRLAARGVVFEQAHVQHTQCTPSRIAVMSGRYLHVVGHRTQTHLLQTYEPNVFRYLKNSGYTTIMLGKNDMLSVDSFNSTFTFWENDIGTSGGPSPFTKPSEPGYYSFAASAGGPGNTTKGNGDLLATTLISDWIASDPPEPFAVWISGIGAHPPYGAPAGFYDMYSAAQVHASAPLRPYSASANKPAFIGPNGIPGFRNLNSFNDSFFEGLAAVYYGRVSYMDYVLGDLMDGLDRTPSIASNTALFMTSDHGDYAGDWHNVEKYPCALDDVLTRVPLIASFPGGQAGVRAPAPVETLDLFATLLDAAGILGNETDAAHPVERHFSQSLLPFILGSPSAKGRDWVFSEGGYVPNTIEVEPLDPEQAKEYAQPNSLYYPRGKEELVAEHCTRALMIRNETMKLVYRCAPAASELYDLSQDPRELQNLWGVPQYASVQVQMQLAMLDWLAATSDITPLIEDPRGVPDFPGKPVSLSDTTRCSFRCATHSLFSFLHPPLSRLLASQPFPWPPVARGADVEKGDNF